MFRPLGVVAEGFEAPVGAHPAPDAAGVPLPHEARQHKGVDPARGQAAVDDNLVSGLSVICLQSQWHRRLAGAGVGCALRTLSGGHAAAF